MEFEQQPLYEVPPPPRPIMWIGLTIFFAFCCCCFAFVAVGEAAWIATGGVVLTGETPSSSTNGAKGTIGTIRFCIEQPDANSPCSPTVTKIPTTTKIIYATFDYKNMPKTSTYAYEWALNDEPLTVKEKVKWPKETSGVVLLRLDVSKTGEYRLLITPTNGDEKETTIKAGQ